MAEGVLAEANRAADAMTQAIAKYKTALAELDTSKDSPAWAAALNEVVRLGKRSEDAIAAAQTALERFRPWREAEERLLLAAELARIIESN